MDYRIEHDSMGEVLVPSDKLWGAQTQRSFENFKIGCGAEQMPVEIIRAFAILKKAAAITNNSLLPEKMTSDKLSAIFKACDEILSGALGEECSFNVVRSVHEQIAEMIEAHKESKDPEPLAVTKNTVKEVLAYSGVGEEGIERVCEAFDENFGKNAALTPKNIISPKKFDLKMPEVSIKVSPEFRDIVTTETVGGEKYVRIRVSGGVEVNGISISFDE